MNRDRYVILRVVSKGFLPVIFLFALYVHFHAKLGPGGAFQGGSIIAAGVMLYALVFGLREAMAAIPPVLTRTAMALGVVIYAGVGVWSMMNGGNYLEYQALFGEPPGETDGQYWGIVLVELGVLLTVAGAALTIFYSLAGRVAEIQGDDW